jgi:hypothetical protein
MALPVWGSTFVTLVRRASSHGAVALVWIQHNFTGDRADLLNDGHQM